MDACRDKIIVIDYLSGGYRCTDLAIKYNMSLSGMYRLIHRMLSEDVIDGVERKNGRMTKCMRLNYMKLIGDNIIEDYKKCEFSMHDLAVKYNLGDSAINLFLDKKLTNDEIYNIYSKVLSKRMRESRTLYTADFCKLVVEDYRTGEYYYYMLAEKYNILYGYNLTNNSISTIICKYMDKLERKTIQNNLYNRNRDGNRLFPHSFGMSGRVFSKKLNKDVIFRSKLEKIAIMLLENDESVINYTYEPIRIMYGDCSAYIPDFKVEYSDGRVVIIEVKMKRELDLEINRLKFESAEKYCRYNGMEFIVWNEDYLSSNSSL